MTKKSCMVLALACLCGFQLASADTIVMADNHVLTGTAIQTNDDDVLILTRYAAFNFSKAGIKGILPESVATSSSSTSRLPDFQSVVRFLSRQPWAAHLTPVPATVIDRGILRNVPYTSFHCGGDYEVNIYGDLEHPAGIEVGVYRKLLNDDAAKDNCVKFISHLLGQDADKLIVQGLDLDKDLKTRDGLTFEVTPADAVDAYNGWWISVYSERQLNLARASDDGMQLISMTQADAAKDAIESTNLASWSADDLKQARPAGKTTISFVNSSGVLITNAEVVRVIDGVSLIWRTGPTSEGMVRLADLPEDLRIKYGYDEVKTKAADDLAKAQRRAWDQSVQAVEQAARAVPARSDFSSYGDSGYSTGGYSGGGRVYVHGYIRKDGTYVHAYTRSYPHKQ